MCVFYICGLLRKVELIPNIRTGFDFLASVCSVLRVNTHPGLGWGRL
jgi:hypothetical protein